MGEVSDLKSHLKQLESEKRELAKQLENHAHHGHDHGHEEEEECECPFGQHQSPINIISDVDGVKTIQMSAGQQKNTLEFAYPHLFTGCSILNNGYTVQINIGDQDTNPGTVEVAGKVYTLRQFHLHTPSEKMMTSNVFLNQFWAQFPMKKCDDIPLDNDLTFDHMFEASSFSVKKTSRRGQVLINMDIFRYDGS